MRPTRLELEGFISFRERTEIDFSSLDLFGITGPTGAGKTALIDSMIFALYGKTPRLGEKAVQELISQGAPQLKVLLEFAVGSAAYRVLRIVKRKGAGRTQIEQRGPEGEWEPIAGSTRELRDRVEDIIGLDFDGFTKTVVLPQGQFDRFLRGDGAARRKILSDLLGLDVYERMMRRANEIARDANRQCDVLTEMAAQQYGAATPERLQELDQAIGDAATEQTRAAAQVSALEKALPLVIQLRHAEADFARYQAERDRLRKSLEGVAAQVGAARRRIEDLRGQSAEAGYDAQRHLDVTSMLPVARRHGDLERSVAALTVKQRGEVASEAALVLELEAARTTLSAAAARTVAAGKDGDRAEAAWVAFRLKHGSADLLSQAARDAAGLSKIRRGIGEIEKQIAGSREALARTVAEAELLLEKGRVVEARVDAARRELERIRLLHAAAGVRRLLELGEPCPVCLHTVDELPDPDRGHASLESAEGELRAAEAERERVRSASSANRLELETLPKRVEADGERVEQLTASMRAIEEVAERLAGERVEDPAGLLKKLEERAKSAEAEAGSAARVRRSAGEAEATLLASFKGLEMRLALLRQARESTARELDEKRREMAAFSMLVPLAELEAEAKALGKARDLNERLVREQAEAERAASKAEVDERSISERLALTVATLASLSERAGEIRGQLEGLPVDEGIDARLAEARERLQKIDGALGAARLARKTVADQAREAAELGKRVALLGKEGAVYSRLGALLRTDQFVAWILKDAFARLAYEGSRQLETLSNGRYTFAAGGDDFAVCDRWNAGERRSVNTLSGGESFLASLSLALALSRGLPEFAASRDRLHLDSLFLDEGFSTLDAETLDTVLGAVEMLQSDCRLIGVISHAPELAERLPGRIEVVKGANGSRVVVR